MKKTILIISALASLMLLSCTKVSKTVQAPKTAPVTYAGIRCSSLNIKPFPAIEPWTGYAKKMGSCFDGSTPTFVWIVGNIEGNSTQQNCIVNFPLSKKIKGVSDFPVDQNKEFLDNCDKNGYAVWLQVEPGDCDLVALASETMKRYKDHPSVKGFGVDVEWYCCGGEYDGTGKPLTDKVAKEIDVAIKKVDKRFNYFVKHWDYEWMPPTYRSDIIFVCDSQQHYSLNSMKKCFNEWGDYFAPNTVMFQIGYEADKKIWSGYDNPPKELGSILAEHAGPDQHVGIIWVDFTLKNVMKKIK